MAKKDYSILASKIVDLVGGKENVRQVIHCQTRLRFNLADDGLADEEALKSTDGVLGVVRAGVQLQVVIGADVANVFDEVVKLTGGNPGSGSADNMAKEKLTPKRIGSAILDGLSGSLGPVIPVITACAFFKMLTSLLGPDMLNVMSAESHISILLGFVGDAGFYFFPVIIGYCAAKKFNVLPVLGILLGCIMMHPTFIGLAGQEFSVFGIPCNVQNYGSTVLPIIMSVWVMSFVERFFNKVVPAAIRSVFAPALTITVMLPVTLCVLGPAGAFLGNYVVAGLLGLQGLIGFLGTAIIAALYPFLVMTGMHMVLITALFQVFASQGYDGFAGPALTYASFAIMGVCIGAMLRLKDKEQKAMAAEFSITAVVAGTSEPCLYGICARYKRPFIGLLAGGFAGGLYGGITGVISANLVPSTNFLSALAFTGSTTSNLVNGIIACGIAVIVAAATTYFFGFDRNEPAVQPPKSDEAGTAGDDPAVEDIEVYNPITGNVLPLNQIDDPVFSQGVLGPGYGIEPEEETVYAPFDGTVTQMMDTKHAVGLTGRNGMEVLIHVGMDTVTMNGKGFNMLVSEGQDVIKGQKLMTFSIADIKEAGHPATTAVVLTNSDEFGEIELLEQGKTEHSVPVLRAGRK